MAAKWEIKENDELKGSFLVGGVQAVRRVSLLSPLYITVYSKLHCAPCLLCQNVALESLLQFKCK